MHRPRHMVELFGAGVQRQRPLLQQEDDIHSHTVHLLGAMPSCAWQRSSEILAVLLQDPIMP